MQQIRVRNVDVSRVTDPVQKLFSNPLESNLTKNKKALRISLSGEDLY